MRMLTAAAIAATLMALISWPAQAQMGSGAHRAEPAKNQPGRLVTAGCGCGRAVRPQDL
jgi:hypothetical protein